MPLTQPLWCRAHPSPAAVPAPASGLVRRSNLRTRPRLPRSALARSPSQFRVLRTTATSLFRAKSSYFPARPPPLPSNVHLLPLPPLSLLTTPTTPTTIPSTTLPLMATQARGHSGHGHHHHHHHHGNAYLTSSNTHDAGVRITRLGLVANLAMAIGKFIGGYVFHSQALIADAYHALTDLVSDFLTLGTVAWSLKPPSERFPNGYGKIESIGALGVSGLLLCGGVFMGLNSGQVLLDQFYPEAAEAISHLDLGHGHSHSHGVDALGPSIHAAWLAAGSIVVKEWLYHASEFPFFYLPLLRVGKLR